MFPGIGAQPDPVVAAGLEADFSQLVYQAGHPQEEACWAYPARAVPPVRVTVVSEAKVPLCDHFMPSRRTRGSSTQQTRVVSHVSSCWWNFSVSGVKLFWWDRDGRHGTPAGHDVASLIRCPQSIGFRGKSQTLRQPGHQNQRSYPN